LSWRDGDPFSLGVASGAPSPGGFTIWTRLDPQPLSPDGGGGHATTVRPDRLRNRDR
jgi:alkaline phosphatase D